MQNKIVIGDISWMRSDYRKDITVGGITYPTLEHAYQASKTKDRSVKRQIADTDSVRDARKIGRSLQQSDNFDRETVMAVLQRLKYTDKDLGEMLAHTGSEPIVMEGYDDFWGTGEDGNGQDVMGGLLQSIRSELQIVYGVDVDDDGCNGDCDHCKHDDEEVPLLKEAILNVPDEGLAVACQALFDGAKAIISLLDANDYNADYIANKTGRPRELIEGAIKKVQVFQSTLTSLEELLEKTADEDFTHEDEDEEDEDDDDDQSRID
jgi:N-glycosidase YbiA